MTATTGTGPRLNRKALEDMLHGCPFHRFLQLQLVDFSVEAGRIAIAIDARPEFSRTDARIELHGGIIASLIDLAGDYAVALRTGAGVPTTGLHVDYLRPARGASATATARVLRAGRTVAIADVEVHDETGRLIAVGRASYSTAGRSDGTAPARE